VMFKKTKAHLQQKLILKTKLRINKILIIDKFYLLSDSGILSFSFIGLYPLMTAGL